MPYLLIVLLFFAGQSLAAEQPIELPTPTGMLSGTLGTRPSIAGAGEPAAAIPGVG